MAAQVAPGYELVAEQFERNLRERGDVGAAFAAYVDGRLVVDVWGGLADRAQRRPWRRDTIAGVFSGSKGLVATCMLMLLERGVIDLDAPVARYWPEFGAHGKEGLLVRHVVAHQAGLPGVATPIDAEEAADAVRMAALLAAQSPVHVPGTQLCYHALTFGWLCGELVRRVDGRSIGRFFAEEIAGPLGLDTWIGLPEREEPRVAVLEADAGFAALGRSWDRARDQVGWSIWANPPRFSADPLPANTRAWHAAEIPASSAITDARSLARLYGCLARGGEIDRIRLLAPESLALAAAPLAQGVDPYLGQRLSYSVGFILQTDAHLLGPPAIAFGHGGSGGSMHGAWPQRRTGFSYVTATLRGSDGPDPRAAALLRALHEAAPRSAP